MGIKGVEEGVALFLGCDAPNIAPPPKKKPLLHQAQKARCVGGRIERPPQEMNRHQLLGKGGREVSLFCCLPLHRCQ